MLDILIKGGMVIDGTGQKAFQADVGVAEGRIAVISQHVGLKAVHSIDAQGLHVAPGFIDPHAHSDYPLLVNRYAESKIRQGVTTEVVGNCGFSPAPLVGEAVAEGRTRMAKIGVEVTWRSMGEYLDHLRNPGIAVNVVPLIGHNIIRSGVLGYDDVQPTPEQQVAMERLVREAMEQGGRGLSTGLFYPPGYYATTEEIIGLARVVGEYGGIYASHVRSESDLVLEAIAEALEIGEKSAVPVEVSHVKIEGYHNYDKIDRLLAMMDEGQAKELPVGFDQYPYTAAATWLSTALPHWVRVGGAKALAERINDVQLRAKLHRDWQQNRLEWDNRLGIRDWNDAIISDFPNRPDLLGKSIAEIAQGEGKDPLDTVFDLIAASRGLADCILFTQSEEIVQTLMQHPLVAIGSDGSSLKPEGVLGQRKAHPRNYGTFPRVLGHYAREKKTLTLEQAVKKMTSMSAKRFGLKDRGVIREGAWADLVLFDANTVSDTATYTSPHAYPTGIPYVIVNGRMVIEQDRHTGVLPGRVL